jgi:hypothetical protein
VSASDTEDDLALQTNHVGDLADDQDLCCAAGLECPRGSFQETSTT